MASTSQKKTTKKTSGKSGSRTTAKKPQPRPIRREVGGVVCLVLALCVFVSYFGISAIFIDWLAVLIKGLLGYGYWLFGPALVLAGCILLFHHGRPVTLRVTSALLLPVLLGTLCHMLLVKEAYASSIGIIPAMWKDGVALKCGGVISGALGQGSVAVFSKIASIIIFTVLFVVLLMVALRLTVGALIEKHRERPKYEEEPEPEKPVREAKRPQETVAAIPAESARSRIDIPVDDPVNAPAPKPEKTGFTSFFRHKSDKQKTPAQVVEQSGTAEPVVSVMEDEGDPFANARVHPSPGTGSGAYRPAAPGQGNPHHGAGGGVYVGGAAGECPGSCRSKYSRAGDGACCRTCCAGAADQKGGGPGRSCGDSCGFGGNRRKYGGERGGIPLPAGEFAA